VTALFCAWTLLFAGTGQQDSPKEATAALVKKAKKAAKADKHADAYLLYSEAAAMQPGNKRLKQKMEALQARAALESSPVLSGQGRGGASDVPTLDPGTIFDSPTAAELARARQLRAPPSLKAKAGTQDFDLTGNARALFDQVAKRFGLEALFDGDYPASGPQFRFRIEGLDYREALHDLEAMTNSFVAPLSSRLFMVAQDTPAKRNDLEQFVVVTVPVPEALTTQELTEIGQAVKQVTNIDKITWDTADRMLIMRDRISRVLPAQALLEQLFAWRAQVAIEVEFLEVTDSDLKNYGFNLTNSIQAVYLGSILHSVPSIPAAVTQLMTFGGGRTLIGLGVAEVNALFNESVSTTRTLFRATSRSVDSQPVTFHVGEKYPVITQGYFGSTTAQQGTTFQPPPAFTFENLGVELKVTPHMHGEEGVTLAVDTKFELLTGSSVNGIPIIGQRQTTGQVRLVNGEWAVVAGIMGSTDSKSDSGFWGLAQIPLLGHLFRQTATDKEHEDLLIAIRPHLLSLPPDQIVTKRVRVGTETRPFTPL
jgi:general secretion pathway protein D